MNYLKNKILIASVLVFTNNPLTAEAQGSCASALRITHQGRVLKRSELDLPKSPDASVESSWFFPASSQLGFLPNASLGGFSRLYLEQHGFLLLARRDENPETGEVNFSYHFAKPGADSATALQLQGSFKFKLNDQSLQRHRTENSHALANADNYSRIGDLQAFDRNNKIVWVSSQFGGGVLLFDLSKQEVIASVAPSLEGALSLESLGKYEPGEWEENFDQSNAFIEAFDPQQDVIIVQRYTSRDSLVSKPLHGKPEFYQIFRVRDGKEITVFNAEWVKGSPSRYRVLEAINP